MASKPAQNLAGPMDVPAAWWAHVSGWSRLPRHRGRRARGIPGRTSRSTKVTRLGWTLRSPNFLYLTMAAELAARLAPAETTGVRLARMRSSAMASQLVMMDGRSEALTTVFDGKYL